MQTQMHRAERAAVVASGDAAHALDTRGLDADSHRLFDGGLIDAVDDNLVNGVDAVGERRLDVAAQRRAIGVVGARLELLVTAADLASRANDAAWKRHDDAGNLAHRG